jgi:hypothetical protein
VVAVVAGLLDRILEMVLVVAVLVDSGQGQGILLPLEPLIQ